jgi:pyrroline-5-carboxylate reductase
MKILFIGAGKMGLSIISAWSKSHKNTFLNIHVVEKNLSTINKIKKNKKKISISRKVPSNWTGELVLFAIKPQDFSKISNEILKNKIKFKNIISIMAGVTIKKICNDLRTNVAVARVMPNLAVKLNLGVSCIYYPVKTKMPFRKKVNSLFNILGNTYNMKNEKLLETVTAISGSGPAYLFLFIQVFERIACDLGFSKIESKKIVYDTIEGAFELVKKENNTISLIKSVSSKKGTTEAAIQILENKNTGLYKLLSGAINAAKNRANELSQIK